MNFTRAWMSVAAFAWLTLTGCHSKESSAPDPSTSSISAAAPAPSQGPGASAVPATSDGISAARNSLKAGQVDEAAARLAQLQMQSATFNAQQAKDYRQTLSEAYDRAIEAAQRGDPKAQAALQLLRAASPR